MAHERSEWLPASPFAWTFPAGLLLLTSTCVGLVLFLLIPRTMPLACEMEGRLSLAFAIGGGTGALLLPVAIDRWSPVARGIAAVAGVVVCGGLAWIIVANAFPRFC